MDDEEFKANVMRSLQTLEGAVVQLGVQARENGDQQDRRLKAIVARLDEQVRDLQTLDAGVGQIDGRMRADREHLDRRLDAVVSRLDEQDPVNDRIMQKLDRLATHVATAAQASEQALDAVTLLARRVHKLEYPDERSGIAGGAAPPR